MSFSKIKLSPLSNLHSNLHRMKQFFLVAAVLLYFSFTGSAGKKYVSVSGNDAANGNTPATAYRTIRSAVTKVPAGDTLVVIPGIFTETDIRITTRMTIMKGTGAGDAIIDATGLSFSLGSPAIIIIVNVSDVTIDGLTIRNGIFSQAKGIWIVRNTASGTGAMRNINILNCVFRNIGWTNSDNLHVPQYDRGTGTGAIVVAGEYHLPISAVNIIGNTVKKCATGWGEAITIRCNVDTFSIINNIVDSIANIGIVAAGNYDCGSAVPSPVGYSRNGIIRGNAVSNCMSGNATSAGIYIDGARNCLVENNRCFRNGAGMSLGAEQPSLGNLITGNIFRNNLVYDNSVTGMVIGSLLPNNNVTKNYILNNSFFRNCTAAHINGIDSIGVPPNRHPVEEVVDGAAGQVQLQHNDRDTFQNNIIYPLITRRGIVGMSACTVTNFSSNYNLYYHEDASPLFYFGAGHNFNGNGLFGSYTTIAGFTTAAGQEQNGVYGNPAFVNASAFDLHLGPCSFAIDKGNPLSNAALNSSTDFSGSDPRIAGGRADAGAYEYQPAVSLCNFLLGSPVSSCNGSIHQIKLSWSVSVHATSYDVYRNAAFIANVTDTSYLDLPGAAGTYSYLIKARQSAASMDNNNGAQSGTVNCVVTAVPDPQQNPFSIQLSPNPAMASTTITAQNVLQKQIIITIYDMNGREMYKEEIKRQSSSQLQYVLPLQLLADGNYLVKVQIGQQSYTLPLLKK